MIYAGNALIAEASGASAISYRLLDQEGSLAMTTDGSGNVTGTNVLSPYGETLSSNTNDSFSYAGLTQDTEYGGDAASFRNYSTEQTRWLRPDPYNGSYDLANPQSFNRYMYVNGNPLAFTDPSGQGSACVDGICVPWFPGVLNTVGSAVDIGLFAANFLNDVFGLWGQPPQFTGNVNASQSGKNVPQQAQAQNCGVMHPCTTVQVNGTNPPPPNTMPSAIGQTLPLATLASGQYPTRLFNTHWCGPGGAGPTVNQLDAACKAHDQCYDANGFTPWSSWDPFQFPNQIQALQQCNQNLCNAAAQTNDPGSTRVDLFFTEVVPVGACRPF